MLCLIFTEHANQIHSKELTDRDSITKIKKNIKKFFQQAESEVEEFMNELHHQKAAQINFEEYDNAGASPLSLKWKFLLPKTRTRRQAFPDSQADTINEIISRLTNLEASYSSHLSRLNSISDSLSSLQTSTTSA